MLGCGPGWNPAETVILERDSESTIAFNEGSRGSYLGYLTLRFSPDVTSNGELRLIAYHWYNEIPNRLPLRRPHR